MAPLLSLPNELLLFIIEELEYASEINALAQTCRDLCDRVNPLVYEKYATTPSPRGIKKIFYGGNLDSLQKLLESGADLSRWCFEMKFGMPAPHEITGFLKSMELMLESSGRSTFFRGNFISYAWTWAIRNEILDVVEFFLSHQLPVPSNALELAVETGMLSVVKLLVQGGMKVNGNPGLLLKAMQYHHLAIVEFLLESGVSPNHPSGRDEDMPLCQALLVGTEEIVRALVNAGARLGNSKISPVFMSCFGQENGRSKVSLVMQQVDVEAELRDSTFQKRGILLVVATALHNEPLVRRLLGIECDFLDLEADMDAFDVSVKMRAIYLAASRGYLGILQLLLDNFRDTQGSLLDKGYFAAVAGAMKRNRVLVLALVLAHGGQDHRNVWMSPVFAHALNERHDVMSQLLVDLGALHAEEEGELHLHVIRAIERNNYDVAERIMDFLHMGPLEKIHAIRNSEGLMVFQYAARWGPVDGFKRILARGVILDPHDEACQFALSLAAMQNQDEIMEIFLDNGFSVDSSYPMTKSKRSPLLVTVAAANPVLSPERDALPALRLLLDRGADVNASDSRQSTALCKSIRRSNPEVTKELLARGANPLVGAKQGKSALQAAVVHGKLDVVEMLLQAIVAGDFRYHAFHALIPFHFEDSSNSQAFLGLDADRVFAGATTSDLRWHKFSILKAMRRHYWRSMHPVSGT